MTPANRRHLRLLFCLPIALPITILMWLIRPIYLIRIGSLGTQCIGCFASGIDLYLCKIATRVDVPRQRHVDIFYTENKIANYQLLTMVKRVVHVFSGHMYLLFDGINMLNRRIIPGGKIHVIDFLCEQHVCIDSEGNNIIDYSSGHLKFTSEEEARGESGLRAIGLPLQSKFVCLLVRDGAYYASDLMISERCQYRNCNIDSYLFAAEELVKRGYFVIRMGAKVEKPFCSKNPKIIDYAFNGMRSDFMDIYLASKCDFFITTGSGFDIVASHIFRKPMVYTNLVPVSHATYYFENHLFTTRRHLQNMREMTLNELVACDFTRLSWGYDFKANRDAIKIIENSPEEICDVVLEMVERLNNTWQPHERDEDLQKRFWEIFPTDMLTEFANELKIQARFSAKYLRDNEWWLNLVYSR